MAHKFAAQRGKSIAITDNGHPCPIRKQASDQWQGALDMTKAHGADRKKNAAGPQARFMAACRSAQAPLTCRCAQALPLRPGRDLPKPAIFRFLAAQAFKPGIAGFIGGLREAPFQDFHEFGIARDIGGGFS